MNRRKLRIPAVAQLAQWLLYGTADS